MAGDYSIEVADLSTENGICAAAVKMGEVVCQELLWPVVAHTPADKQADLFERFFCALMGAAVAQPGPERAKEICDAAKLAVNDLIAERNVHAH